MTSVILADDHSYVRAGLELMLKEAGLEVVAALDNGLDVLAAVSDKNPDLLILDLKMPRMDGVGVLQSLRSQGDERPVILLTAEIDDDSLLEAVRIGVNGLFLKDGAPDALIEGIDGVMKGVRKIDPVLLDRSLSLALAEPVRSQLDLLTKREREISDWVAKGFRNRDIARELGITEGSIKVFLHRIYEKVGVESRTELALLVLGQSGRP